MIMAMMMLSGAPFFFQTRLQQDFKTYYCAKYNKSEFTNMTDAYLKYILEELGTTYFFKSFSSLIL
jgi:hypothetical protein